MLLQLRQAHLAGLWARDAEGIMSAGDERLRVISASSDIDDVAWWCFFFWRPAFLVLLICHFFLLCMFQSLQRAYREWHEFTLLKCLAWNKLDRCGDVNQKPYFITQMCWSVRSGLRRVTAFRAGEVELNLVINLSECGQQSKSSLCCKLFSSLSLELKTLLFNLISSPVCSFPSTRKLHLIIGLLL